jgi:hypothetical protein
MVEQIQEQAQELEQRYALHGVDEVHGRLELDGEPGLSAGLVDGAADVGGEMSSGIGVDLLVWCGA